MACHHLPSVRCTECAYGYGTYYPTYPIPTTYVPPTPPPAKPHTCPVCEGTGKVAEDFYGDERSSNVLWEPGKCRSCHGGGIVWQYTFSSGISITTTPASS